MENNNNLYECIDISFGDGGFKNANVTGSMSLKKMFEVIQTGRWEEHNIDLVSLSKAIKETTDKKEQTRLKAKLLWVTASGLCTGTCSDQNMIQHSGYVQVDFDKGDNPDWFQDPLKEFELDRNLKDDPFINFYWISPSGGRKALVRIPPSFETHRASFKASEIYFKEKYNVIIDSACKNPSRKLCLSHSPTLHINYDCKLFDEMKYELTSKDAQIRSNDYSRNKDYDQVVNCIIQLEENHIDITDKYDDWFALGCAFSTFGEAGRSFFHRTSFLSSKYNNTECDKLYSGILKNQTHSVTIATFFWLCKKVNISPRPEDATKKSLALLNANAFCFETEFKKLAIEEKLKGQKKPVNKEGLNPFISDSVYSQLPDMVKGLCVNFESGRQRDMFLVSFLAVISSCLPNVFGLYNHRWIPTNLYFMITAPFASGKSVATWAIRLADPIHKMLKERHDLELAEYYEALKNKEGIVKKPGIKLHHIPANISAAGLIELLNNNTRGLIAETETDTILAAWGNKEWGNYSDIMRAAAENEPIKLYRKVQKELVEAMTVYLSILVTGTPKSTEKLFVSPENGLFSRFLFYYFTENIPFKNPFHSDESFESIFDEYALHLLNVYKHLNSVKMIRVSLTEDQKMRFHKHFEDIVDNAPTYYGIYTGQILKRLAAMHFKLCMILTTLKAFENGEVLEEIYCDENNFIIALELITILKEHSFTVLQTLPEKEKDDNSSVRHKLYAVLPDQFTTAEAVNSTKASMGASERTIKRMLADWQVQGKIERVKHGTYKKLHNNTIT